MKFKTRLISTAVAAALGTIAGGAQAVNLGQDGQGQVLLYPYYTVQTKGSGATATAADTYMTIVNSDPVRGKAVKVRFIEGKASREVLDFNLYLSPNDVWTAAITRNGAGDPILRTWDTSCTAPQIPVVAGTQREVAFVNFDYAGDAVGDDSLARAREGYIEVIQMADLTAGTKTADGKIDTYAASKHVGGVPPGCAAIEIAWLTGSYSTATDGMAVGAPTGTLSGFATIINPLEGSDLTTDAVALDAFTNVADHEFPGSIFPNLASVTPKVSNVLVGSNGYTTNWVAGIIAGLTGAVPVSAVLMRNQIINEYAVAAAPVGLGTDWVITMPTKRLHIESLDVAPFDPAGKLGKMGWCEPMTVAAYDREEGVTVGGLPFSPPAVIPGGALCWESNVISFANGGTVSNVLGSVNLRQTLTVPYSVGWLRMGFTALTQTIPGATSGINTVVTPLGGAPAAAAAVTYNGLPVIGTMFQSFVNTGTLANYGGTATHRYARNIF